ncbi:hypothetical protein H8E77_27770, partial [bacterium]|nr:hypothetical protein [bacterium]
MYLPTHPINNEYIKEWLIIGPFLPADLDADFLADVGGEANIRPREGDTVITSDDRLLTWHRYCAKGHVVALDDVLEMHENTTVYAACILRSEAAGEGRFHFGRGESVAGLGEGGEGFLKKGPPGFLLGQKGFCCQMKTGVRLFFLETLPYTGL